MWRNALPLVLAACSAACAAPKTAADVSRAALAAATVSADGRPVHLAQLGDALRRADVVCLGEQHDDANHHWVQHAILWLMLEQSMRDARQLGLGMEMFQQPSQPLLDHFVRGTIDELELRRLGDWRKNWGYDFAMYAPMLRVAHDYRVPLLALNAPRALSRRIAREGLPGLPTQVRERLPEMKLDDEEHRSFFQAAMGGDAHGSHGVSERYYAAQVLWDETMAAAASQWLADPRRRRRLLVVAGNGHCHESAIVRRIERRQPHLDALSVLQAEAGDEPIGGARSDFVISLPSGWTAPGSTPALP
jgi:uncharacterized iron-regulated protein